MKHFLHILILVFLPTLLFAQESKTVSIQVLDKDTRTPVIGAHIQLQDILSVSNVHGKTTMDISQKAKIRISHIAYRDTGLFIYPSQNLITVFLQSKISELPTAQVNNEAYAVFSPETTHVFDYEFMSDTLLVLTYEKEQMFRREKEQSEDLYLGCELIVVSPSGNIIHTSTLPDYTSGFHRDGIGQLFVKGKRFAKMVTLTKFGPSFIDLDYNVFVSQIIPLKNSSSKAYYFDDQSWDYPEFTHYSKTRSDEEISAIRTIRDHFTMELFRAEYKYMSNRDKLKAIRLEYDTGIDKEIYGAYMSGFQHSLFYHSIYAPLFCFGDTTAIFDHHNGYIYFHDLNGKAIDSTSLYYNEKAMGKFDNELVQDPINNRIYAIYKRNGRKFLREVSLENGGAHDKVILHYPYPEKIKVIDNRVYYVYRKTEGRDTKHLYAEYLSQ